MICPSRRFRVQLDHVGKSDSVIEWEIHREKQRLLARIGEINARLISLGNTTGHSVGELVRLAKEAS